MYRKVLILLILVVFAIGKLDAQNIEYGVRFDSTQMLIGDHQNLTFIVRSQIPLSVKFPQFEEQIGDLEIISGPVADSTRDDEYYTYTNAYKVTAFDTGLYVIPPQQILIAQEGFDNALTTDSIMVAVNTLVVDKEKGIVDIQAPYDAPITFKEILPYLIYLLLGLLLIVAIVYIIIRLTSGKPIVGSASSAPIIPPYILAKNALNDMNERKLWQAGSEKQFYTELTDTLREYLDGELGLQCMESTSAQIMDYLKKVEHIGERDRLFIDDMLSTADLVKFAKMMPLQDENFNYIKGTEACIERIHTNVVALLEAQKAKEAQELQKVHEAQKTQKAQEAQKAQNSPKAGEESETEKLEEQNG